MERWQTELWRKTVHIGFGACALLLRWLTPAQSALLALAALLFNLFLLHRLTGRSLLRKEERAGGFSWGVALYPAVVLILILVFHARLELAAAVWGLVALGDGMATVVGVLPFVTGGYLGLILAFDPPNVLFGGLDAFSQCPNLGSMLNGLRNNLVHGFLERDPIERGQQADRCGLGQHQNAAEAD